MKSTSLPIIQIIGLPGSGKTTLGKKKKSDRGGDWLFSDDYRDKYEFVRKMFKHFKDLPSEIEIDTTRLTPQEVFTNLIPLLNKYNRD